VIRHKGSASRRKGGGKKGRGNKNLRKLNPQKGKSRLRLGGDCKGEKKREDGRPRPKAQGRNQGSNHLLQLKHTKRKKKKRSTTLHDCLKGRGKGGARHEYPSGSIKCDSLKSDSGEKQGETVSRLLFPIKEKERKKNLLTSEGGRKLGEGGKKSL